MRTLLGKCLVGLSLAFILVGVVGFFAIHLVQGPETGAPFNIFAGLIMLRWAIRTPLALLCIALVVGGALALSAGASLVDKPASQRRR